MGCGAPRLSGESPTGGRSQGESGRQCAARHSDPAPSNPELAERFAPASVGQKPAALCPVSGKPSAQGGGSAGKGTPSFLLVWTVSTQRLCAQCPPGSGP